MKKAIIVFLAACNIAMAHTISPLGLRLEGYDYPYPIHTMNLQIENQNCQLAYMDVLPSGKSNQQTVLLLHGGLAFSAYWKETINFLSNQGYRVIVPDQIGFGKSSKNNLHYNFYLLADNTKKLLDYLKIDKAFVVGHSMGGIIAERLALLYPEKISKLVLEDPLGLEEYSLKIPYKSAEYMYQHALNPSWDSIQNQYKSLFAKWDQKYVEYVDVAYRLSLNPKFFKIARIQSFIYEVIYTESIVHELQNIKVPTLIMYGEFDRVAPGKNFADPDVQKTLGNFPELVKNAFSKIPHSSVYCFKNTAHVPHLEAAEEFNNVLNQFFITN